MRPASVSIVSSGAIGRSIREGAGKLVHVPLANDEDGAPLLRWQQTSANCLTEVCQIRTTSFRIGLHRTIPAAPGFTRIARLWDCGELICKLRARSVEAELV